MGVIVGYVVYSGDMVVWLFVCWLAFELFFGWFDVVGSVGF